MHVMPLHTGYARAEKVTKIQIAISRKLPYSSIKSLCRNSKRHHGNSTEYSFCCLLLFWREG